MSTPGGGIGYGWLKLDSWHIASGTLSRSGKVRTLCGRWVENDPRPEPAPGEPTCESCFRVREQRAAR